MLDLPKNCEWSLGKYSKVEGKDKNKPFYIFLLWEKNKDNLVKNTFTFKTETAKQMAEKIKKLVKKLNKKKCP